MSLFYAKFYPLREIHQDRNYIYNFWSRDGESIAQAWGRLKSLMLKCPNHELPKEIILTNFYARLSCQDKEMLDASSSGVFQTRSMEEKWNLIERIQKNTEVLLAILLMISRVLVHLFANILSISSPMLN